MATRRLDGTEEYQKHISALLVENRRLQSRSHLGVQNAIAEFPELGDLLDVVVEMIDRADPLQGVVLDDSRGGSNMDYISSDGKSTAAGRATFGDRGRIRYWRKRVGDIVEAVRNDLDPYSGLRKVDDRPRCRRRKCDGFGKRQTRDAAFCGFCRKEFPRSAD